MYNAFIEFDPSIEKCYYNIDGVSEVLDGPMEHQINDQSDITCKRDNGEVFLGMTVPEDGVNVIRKLWDGIILVPLYERSERGEYGTIYINDISYKINVGQPLADVIYSVLSDVKSVKVMDMSTGDYVDINIAAEPVEYKVITDEESQTYTVNFDGCGGLTLSVPNGTVISKNEYPQFASLDCKKEGHTFKGWKEGFTNPSNTSFIIILIRFIVIVAIIIFVIYIVSSITETIRKQDKV